MNFVFTSLPVHHPQCLISSKEHHEKCLLAKTQHILLQFGSEILVLLCSDDPIQILVILCQFQFIFCHYFYTSLQDISVLRLEQRQN